MSTDPGKTVASAGRDDSVRTEVIGAAFATLVEEMAGTLVRTAYSTNIKERRDCTTALFDVEGRAIAQDEGGSPVHLGSLMGIVQSIRDRFGADRIAEGDTFIGNDPFSGGGSHLPDIVITTPVFAGGRLVAWASNLAHHADFGDRGHAHIYQEGLRIPPVHIIKAGVMQEEILDLILLNCQIPGERRADLRAQLAANRVGAKRFLELCERYGTETIARTGDELLDYTERRTRAAVALIPDGEYTFTDVFDAPELAGELPLRIRIVVHGDEIDFDFTGNPPQVRASVNVVWTALYASVYYSLKSLIDADIPPNAGLYRPVTIIAPPGSVLNCESPAAVNARSETCQRIVDLIYGALAPAVPERVTAASNGANTGVHFSGHNPRTGRDFLYLETMGGGGGARASKDGLDGVQVHMTNTSNLPVESLESEYPVQIEAYELVPDSGGAGTYRGGMAIRRVVVAEVDGIHFQFDTTRVTSQPWGLFGGEPGTSARLELSEGAAPLEAGRTVLNEGDRVAIVTGGAGGYGPPSARDPELLERDRREGKTTE
ncbi:hydantoinase B/oxoprolinase family protein [Amycolatopsis sp.]|uniref:hydantoinase B/oxoprolinase family protein n=1 Tax=Amycolatopsis sp. TaxID=37632 RepID=UPI002BC11625|nr:hydantoinase B/oxoprolinase family protein [Amycolatopsis sp.]HVV11454.1 hydantoinase B/oxoprolinase family protein [Amycolatopsis sp.]